ncbi:uncharacterized protein [Antedon mediterranea]
MPAGSPTVPKVDVSLKRARESDPEEDKSENGSCQKQGGDAGSTEINTNKPEVCNGHHIIEHRANLPFLRSSVKRPKRDNTPPPKPKETGKEKVAKVEPKAERKRWEAWSNQDKNYFFKFLNEHGKDFDAIQKHIEIQHKKNVDSSTQVKNKDQVRHLYYRTLHKIAKFIEPKPELSKTARELYALINYGELRKKIKTVINVKIGQKLNELVNNGVTTVRFKGKNVRIKTPVCKALKKLQDAECPKEDKPFRIPLKILVDFQPRNNDALATVQGLAHNPRLRIAVPVQKDVRSVIDYLTSKWTPTTIKLLQTLKPSEKNHETNIILHIPENSGIKPLQDVTGKFIHWSSKTPFTMGQGLTSVSNNKNCQSNSSSPQSTAKLKLQASKMLSTEGTIKNDNKGKGVDLTRKKCNTGEVSNCLESTTSVLTNHCVEASNEAELDTSKTDQLLTSTETMANTEAITASGNHQENIGSVTAKTKQKQTKDFCLRSGLTLENARDINFTDVYLMLGMPSRLKFEYEFIYEEKAEKESTLKTLQKLVHLAKSQVEQINAPKKMVSVGTATSPIRGVQQAGNGINRNDIFPIRNTNGKNDAADLALNKGIVRIAGVVNPGNVTANGSIVDKDTGVFVTPKVSSAPSVVKKKFGGESMSQIQDRLFMQQLNFLHRQQSLNQRGRKIKAPIVVQRHLLPRPQSSAPMRNVMSLTSTGKFTPVDASSLKTVDPSSAKVKIKPVVRTPVNIAPKNPPPTPVVISPINSPVSFVTNSPPVMMQQSMQLSTPVAVVPISNPSVLPIVAAPTPTCSIVAVSMTTNQNFAPQPTMVTSVPTTPQTKVTDSSILCTPSPPKMGTSFTETKDSRPPFSISPPPNLSSILDISLPSADCTEPPIGSESLIAMAMDTAGLTGIAETLASSSSSIDEKSEQNRETGASTPPPSTVGSTNSPFKLTSDPNWLNAETMDLSSLSGFLNGIESPEKKDKTVTLNSLCPPVILCESSRDSIMSTSNFQVDGTLQSLMNENSIDYMAKFADLAAHLDESTDLPVNLNVNEPITQPTQGSASKALDFSSVDFGSGKLNRIVS